MHVVKQPFPYAHDGRTVEQLKVDDQREFRPELVEGLKNDGFIGDIAVKAEPEPEQEAAIAKPASNAAHGNTKKPATAKATR